MHACSNLKNARGWHRNAPRRATTLLRSATMEAPRVDAWYGACQKLSFLLNHSDDSSPCTRAQRTSAIHGDNKVNFSCFLCVVLAPCWLARCHSLDFLFDFLSSNDSRADLLHPTLPPFCPASFPSLPPLKDERLATSSNLLC